MSSPKKPVTSAFTLALPKVELHAHLTGSISPQTLHEIWLEQQNDTTTTTSKKLVDPLIALAPPPGQSHHNILTFFKLFDTYIYSLCNTPSAVAYATRSVLEDFASDGVRYLELRTTPRESLETGLTKDNYVETILSAIEDFHEEEQKQGTDRMRIYLILSIDRRNSSEQAEKTIDLALKFRSRGIVGIDLCGNPLVSLDHKILRPAFQRAKSANLYLTFHFAETPTSSSSEELEFLLSFHPHRLGHVIHLPSSIERMVHSRCIDGDILGLELCISCNVLAKMLPGGGGYEAHHVKQWISREGVGIAICTDDVGVFGKKCSEEFQIVAEKFEGIGRKELVKIVRRSMGMIFGGEEERRRLSGLVEWFVQKWDVCD